MTEWANLTESLVVQAARFLAVDAAAARRSVLGLTSGDLLVEQAVQGAIMGATAAGVGPAAIAGIAVAALALACAVEVAKNEAVGASGAPAAVPVPQPEPVAVPTAG